MKILVTGSSGQIGTNLAIALHRRGDEVRGLDHRENAWTNQVATDIIDLVKIARKQIDYQPPWKPDIIVHLAAWAKVFQLVKEPQKALENVEMSFAAIEMARNLKTPIVFGSSREVYGDIQRISTDETAADFVVAESPYSASKIAGEAFFYSYSRCYKLPHLVFRFSNVYGRYDNDLERMERVIPLFVKKIAKGESITVFGRKKMLDFTYVDDCVAGIVAGIDRLASGKVVNQTINLAYGEGHTLGELVQLIEKNVGRSAVVNDQPTQAGEVTHYIADITKARQLLGYEPKVSLNVGIDRYVKWWRENGWL